jgi:hypothetical protein
MMLPNCVKCIDQSDKSVLMPCKFAADVGNFNGLSDYFYSKLGYIKCIINGQIYEANTDRLCRKYQSILCEEKQQ